VGDAPGGGGGRLLRDRPREPAALRGSVAAGGAVYPPSLQDGVAKAAEREARVGADDLDDYVDASASELAASSSPAPPPA
jgi:hypothetical protein